MSESPGKNLLEDLEIINHGLTSDRDDRNIKMIAASKIRQLLVSDNNFLIQEILKRSWVPPLLKWLSDDQELHLQIGALWALTNIAAGPPEHTYTLIKAGTIPILIELLTSENDEILEQSVWVLGNIAGEGSSSRDSVLSAGVMNPLVDCLNSHTSSQPLLKIGAWAISNLCDGQPRKLGEITLLAELLGTLLQHTDPEVLSHTCWSLSHLCDGPPTYLRTLLEEIPCLCSRLVVLLSHRSWKIVKPALRTIGNIVCAEDEIDYTEMATEAGAVASLCNLVTHSNRDIQKEACWTLSNISAGTVTQIQKVIDSGIMIHIVALARSKETDTEVKSEASWVVLNASSCGSDAQIEQLVEHGSVSVLNDMLSDPSMRLMALEGIERILAIGETKIHRNPRADSLLNPNPYASLLSVEAVESLHATTKSTSLGKRVTKLYKDHFVACTICRKSFHKNLTVLKFCEECKGPVCLDCDCSVYHLSYQEEVWELIESMEVQAKKAQKKKKKQKMKGKAAKKTVAPHPVDLPAREDPKLSEAESAPEIVAEVETEALAPAPTLAEVKEFKKEPKVKSGEAKAQAVPQVRALGNGSVSITAPDSSVDLELLNDESFIAVSRNRRKNGRDKEKDKDRQDKDRKEAIKHAPIPTSAASSSLIKKPTANPKPAPVPTPIPSATIPKPRPPPLINERIPLPLGDSRGHAVVSRYADAVLQSSSPTASVGHSRGTGPLSAIAPVDDFPPLSSSSATKKTNPPAPLSSSPPTPHFFRSTPSSLETSFSHFSNPPQSQSAKPEDTDITPLSQFLSTSSSPPTNGHLPIPANRSLSDLFTSPVLLNPPIEPLVSNGLPNGSDHLYSPPPLAPHPSSLFSPTGLSGDVDIEDGDLHMRRAEMLLGDDDDESDLLNTSRETEDLVEFLQETGSIAALAERLGFRSR